MYLSFTLSGSFQNTLEKLQKASFCPLSLTAHSSHQLLLIISLKLLKQMSEVSTSPYLQKEFMSNKIPDSCSRALKHLLQSSLSVWIETCCDVFGAQLCPLTCFCLLFALIPDLGFWTLKEMGRLTGPLGSAHLCGTEKPANVKVLRLDGILALPYSPQHSTASRDNFNFCGPVFVPWYMKTVSLLFTWDTAVLAQSFCIHCTGTHRWGLGISSILEYLFNSANTNSPFKVLLRDQLQNVTADSQTQDCNGML